MRAFGLAMLATVVLQVALIHPSYGGLASVIGAGTAMSVGQLVAAGFSWSARTIEASLTSPRPFAEAPKTYRNC